jgi:capsid protein
MQLAIRTDLISRVEAISTVGDDAEDVNRGIALDNARAAASLLSLKADSRRDVPSGKGVSP